MGAEERAMEEKSGAIGVCEVKGGVVGSKVGKRQTGLIRERCTKKKSKK